MYAGKLLLLGEGFGRHVEDLQVALGLHRLLIDSGPHGGGLGTGGHARRQGKDKNSLHMMFPRIKKCYR